MISTQKLTELFSLIHLGSHTTIEGITAIKHPQPNYIIPLFKMNLKLKDILLHSFTQGNCFLIPQKLFDSIKTQYPQILTEEILQQKSFFLTEDFGKAFISLLHFFNPYPKPEPVITLTTDLKGRITEEDKKRLVKINSSIAEDVFIGGQVLIGRNTTIATGSVLMGNNYIGAGVELKTGVILHPQVVIHHGTTIGKRTVLHAGTVIGSDGFGYEQTTEGMVKIPQIGKVIVGNDVEIGSNCSIDRATLNHTKIGDRVKIDNLVQIGHNVIIGDDCIIVSQTGIAGSCTIGNRVVIGGQVGIADNVQIGDDVKIVSKSGIYAGKIIPAKAILRGIPAIEHLKQSRIDVLLRDMVKNKSNS